MMTVVPAAAPGSASLESQAPAPVSKAPASTDVRPAARHPFPRRPRLPCRPTPDMPRRIYGEGLCLNPCQHTQRLAPLASHKGIAVQNPTRLEDSSRTLIDGRRWLSRESASETLGLVGSDARGAETLCVRAQRRALPGKELRHRLSQVHKYWVIRYHACTGWEASAPGT